MNAHLDHQANKPRQYLIKMARTYEHYFSDVPMDDTNGSQQPITYESSVNLRKVREATKSLIDGGVNGGISDEDMILIGFYPERKKVNIEIVGFHQIRGLRLAIFAAMIITDLGPIIGIFHNYTLC